MSEPFNIFGFEIRKKRPQEVKSVITPTPEDGSTIVNNAAAHYGLVVDLEGIIKNENDLIRRYRESSQYADCDAAIEEITNEAIVADTTESMVELDLEKTEVSESIKKKMAEEFDKILRLLRFDEKGHDLFRQWYVDGRLYFQVIPSETQKDGIYELRYVDPRKIRKIKRINKEKTPTGVEVVKNIEEYYLYNDRGITEQTTQGVKLSVDSIIHVTSGMQDANTGMTIGHLHKAIKPVNQLKMMEDALVIYRISRAPERRIFYIDVGNLPKARAEQYVNDIMNKFRNKMVYDATTGEVKDNRQHLSMMEDFWMPRREGGKGTEITTLQGGQTLGQIEDVQFFQKKLYQSLNVPIARLDNQTTFNIGRSAEITREELKFNKFINRLRVRFSTLFKEALRVQLILKGIIRPEEWDDIAYDIRFDYKEDNNFAELKNAELINNRVATLQNLDPFVGKYYSVEWVRRNVLMQTDEDIKDIEKQMKAEIPMYGDPLADPEESGTDPAPKPAAPKKEK